MRVIACRTFFLMVLFAVAGPALAADSVSGQFALDGKPPLKPAEIAAFRVHDSFHPGKTSTLVMLTAKPVDRSAIAKSAYPEVAAINDAAVWETDYIQIFVDAEGKVSFNAKFGGKQYAHSSQMGLLASCTSNTPEHVACTVKTSEPVKLMDDPSWSADLTFNSAVIANSAPK